MSLTPNPEGHVTLSELLCRGFDIFVPDPSKLPTYINYSKIHCGNCDEIMYHIKDIAGKGIIKSTWRYCLKCEILIKFAKLEVMRVTF